MRGPAALLRVLLFGALLAACGPSAVSSPTASTLVAAPETASPSAAPAAPALDPSMLEGVWDGIVAGDMSNPVVLRFSDCADGVACGEIEYAPADDPSGVMCAAELTVDGTDKGGFLATERMVFKPWECLATTLVLRPGADETLEVEQYGDLAQPPVASGTVRRISADAMPTPVPVAGPVDGLGTPTSAIDLGGFTTQFTANAFGSLWLPIEQGAVVRVDAQTGLETGRVAIGEPGAVELRVDPHAVAAADDGVWVASAAEHALVLVDAATMAIVRRIPIDDEPYALAIDGRRAWVTSFQGSALVAVDLDEGSVVETVEVEWPTGVAIGEGAVWVIEHRADKVVRVDPETATVVARIDLELGGPDDGCGSCVENLVVAAGSVWTADNIARSVTRIDPTTNRVVARITLPLRVWAVTAGGGSVWASQMEDVGDHGAWMTAEIDPGTDAAVMHSLPAFSVAWAGDTLWTVVPGRRSDVLTRVEPAP